MMMKRLFAAWVRGRGDILVACYESHVVAIDAFWCDRFGCDDGETQSRVGPWNADLFFCGEFDAAWSARTCRRRLEKSMDNWFPLVLAGASAELAVGVPALLDSCWMPRTVCREASGAYVEVKVH